MSDTLIKVENISKKFCLTLKKSLWYGMQDLGNELLGRRHGGDGELRPAEFWAVKDVSFELKRGECLGLIGRNGAGKTTLLRMLNGLIKPDAGRIEMRGRVGALIALGAGFNPILTGWENIYVNATVLGFSRAETKRRLDGIVEFSGLAEHLDTPVQHYSSGMFMRLGFSIAVHCEPDILLIDEALAVGDMEFVIRCINRVAQLRQQGTAVVLVSHNELLVRDAAQRCLLMRQGDGALFDNLDAAFLAYGAQADVNTSLALDNEVVHSGPMSVTSVDAESGTGGEIRSGGDLKVTLNCASEAGCAADDFELRFWNAAGQLITAIRVDNSGRGFEIPPGASRFTVKVTILTLAPGSYRLAGGFRRRGQFQFWATNLKQVEVVPPSRSWGGSGVVMLDAMVEGPMPVESPHV